MMTGIMYSKKQARNEVARQRYNLKKDEREQQNLGQHTQQEQLKQLLTEDQAVNSFKSPY